MLKKAWAVWKGGTISTERGLLRKAPYGFKARFENGKGTNRKNRSAPGSSLPRTPYRVRKNSGNGQCEVSGDREQGQGRVSGVEATEGTHHHGCEIEGISGSAGADLLEWVRQRTDATRYRAHLPNHRDNEPFTP